MQTKEYMCMMLYLDPTPELTNKYRRIQSHHIGLLNSNLHKMWGRIRVCNCVKKGDSFSPEKKGKNKDKGRTDKQIYFAKVVSL